MMVLDETVWNKETKLRLGDRSDVDSQARSRLCSDGPELRICAVEKVWKVEIGGKARCHEARELDLDQ